MCTWVHRLPGTNKNRRMNIHQCTDYPAPILAAAYNFAHLLDDPKLIAWFTQNANHRHPKLFPIPQASIKLGGGHMWGVGVAGGLWEREGCTGMDTPEKKFRLDFY